MMKKIGFIISRKEHENRRAIILDDAKKIKNKEFLYFEEWYFEIFWISDKEVSKLWFNIAKRESLLRECDIICDPKAWDAEYLGDIRSKIIFWWIHATQNYEITQKIIDGKLTAIAWEKMYENNRHVFYKNNEIAWEAAVLHSMLCFGKNFDGLNAAVIWNGNTAKWAIKILNKIWANVTIFTRNKEDLLKKEYDDYNILVNCVLRDVKRNDYLLSLNQLKNTKNLRYIIDISCDNDWAIESCKPTTLENPIYEVNGIKHYVVDHTPSLLYQDSTLSISEQVVKYVDKLIIWEYDKVLSDSIIIKNWNIIDKEICILQNR